MTPEGYFGVVLTLSLLATVGVFLRFTARLRKGTKFGQDDLWMIVAWVMLLGLNVNAGLMYLRGRLGDPFAGMQPSQITYLLKGFYASTVLYFLCMLPVKLSILSLYARLWTRGNFKIAIRAVIVICVAWFLGGIIPTLVRCSPIEQNWKKSPDGKCLNMFTLFRAVTISNLLTDFLVLMVPILAVRKLNLDKRAKLTLTALFMMGGITCLVVFLRIIYQEKLRHAEPSRNLGDCSFWTIAEPAVAILAANLPCLKPLVPANSPLHNFVSALSSKLTTTNKSSTFSAAQRKSWYNGSNKQGTVTTTATAGDDDGFPLNNFSGTYDNQGHAFYEQEYSDLESTNRNSNKSHFHSSYPSMRTIETGNHTSMLGSDLNGRRGQENSSPPHPSCIFVRKEITVNESSAV
ncbi:MAG: hypothetical protein MMC23_007148 [Stictis urceolatum]|nr:hypothetical protein [Stictis urceolata]